MLIPSLLGFIYLNLSWSALPLKNSNPWLSFSMDFQSKPCSLIGDGNLGPLLTFSLNWALFIGLLSSYTHQNDVVERNHKHIVDLGLILLSQAFFSFTYWTYAFFTYVYLINMLLPFSSNNFRVHCCSSLSLIINC